MTFLDVWDGEKSVGTAVIRTNLTVAHHVPLFLNTTFCSAFRFDNFPEISGFPSEIADSAINQSDLYTKLVISNLIFIIACLMMLGELFRNSWNGQQSLWSFTQDKNKNYGGMTGGDVTRHYESAWSRNFFPTFACTCNFKAVLKQNLWVLTWMTLITREFN